MSEERPRRGRAVQKRHYIASRALPSSTGREVGKLQAFATLVNIVSRGEGEFGTIFQAGIIVLARLRA